MLSERSFLLTRPLRDVTCTGQQCVVHVGISTHTPLAGRDCSVSSLYICDQSFLLTRPLRDVTRYDTRHERNNRFLLTRPLRDVTVRRTYYEGITSISTHTPLAGRDHAITDTMRTVYHFYSHAPCGT